MIGSFGFRRLNRWPNTWTVTANETRSKKKELISRFLLERRFLGNKRKAVWVVFGANGASVTAHRERIDGMATSGHYFRWGQCVKTGSLVTTHTRCLSNRQDVTLWPVWLEMKHSLDLLEFKRFCMMRSNLNIQIGLDVSRTSEHHEFMMMVAELKTIVWDQNWKFKLEGSGTSERGCITRNPTTRMNCQGTLCSEDRK